MLTKGTPRYAPKKYNCLHRQITTNGLPYQREPKLCGTNCRMSCIHK